MRLYRNSGVHSGSLFCIYGMKYNSRIFDGIEFREAVDFPNIWFSKNGRVIRKMKPQSAVPYKYIKKTLNPRGMWLVHHGDLGKSMYVHKFIHLLYSGEDDVNQDYYFINGDRYDIRFDNIGVKIQHSKNHANEDLVELAYDYLNGFTDCIPRKVITDPLILDAVIESDYLVEYFKTSKLPYDNYIQAYEIHESLFKDIHVNKLPTREIALKYNIHRDYVNKIRRFARLEKVQNVFGYFKQ